MLISHINILYKDIYLKNLPLLVGYRPLFPVESVLLPTAIATLQISTL